MSPAKRGTVLFSDDLDVSLIAYPNPVYYAPPKQQTGGVFFLSDVDTFDKEPHNSLQNIAFFTDDSGLEVFPGLTNTSRFMVFILQEKQGS
jgi:hypothetical protein